MADQVGSGTVHDAMGEPSGLAPRSADLTAGTADSSWRHKPFHGRPVSWVSVIVIIVGFLIGGVGLVAGPVWWLFWTGLGVTVVGCIMSLAIGIFNDWY